MIKSLHEILVVGFLEDFFRIKNTRQFAQKGLSCDDGKSWINAVRHNKNSTNDAEQKEAFHILMQFAYHIALCDTIGRLDPTFSSRGSFYIKRLNEILEYDLEIEQLNRLSIINRIRLYWALWKYERKEQKKKPENKAVDNEIEK